MAAKQVFVCECVHACVRARVSGGGAIGASCTLCMVGQSGSTHLSFMLHDLRRQCRQGAVKLLSHNGLEGPAAFVLLPQDLH